MIYVLSVANGEIGIFALNGEAYIKKLQNDTDGIFLISLNEKYAPIKVSENDRLDIFGKVLGKSDASAITGHYRQNCKSFLSDTSFCIIDNKKIL